MVIGLTILEGGSVGAAYLAAVFMANLPEAIAATTGLVAGGWRTRRIFGLRSGVVLVSGLASAAGYVLVEDASPRTIAFVLAFAGGAIITMLADTMMPEAYKHGGRLAGVATTLGFAAAPVGRARRPDRPRERLVPARRDVRDRPWGMTPLCPPAAQATGRVSTKPAPPSSSASAMPSTAILNGRQSKRSEMPAKNSTAAKKTVERM
jgi:hypothetical protein